MRKGLLLMIITTLENLRRYNPMGASMEKAIDYIASLDTGNLQSGRYNVDGNDIYALVQCYDTKPYGESKFETHDCYADIQILLEGEELMYTADRKDMSNPTSYNSENDKTNYADNKEAMCTHMKPGAVMIFYPEDAHKASIRVGEQPVAVKKLLLKVRLESGQ